LSVFWGTQPDTGGYFQLESETFMY
jgi:hypothetical protein